jgi:creatine kinase
LLAISEAGKLASLSPSTLAQLAQCAKTGIENPDSGLGCYAMSPADYDELNFFFDPVCNDYHNNPAGDKVHATNWSLKGVEGLPEDGVLDMRKLGLSDPLSMRVRVGRNLKAFPLPGAMTKSDRIKFEQTMLGAFASLVANKDYGGSVFSMTPHADWQGVTGEAENPNLISSSKYDELVKAHVMFKDMDADPYLKSAGIASDWPCGRGCYQSEDGGFIIWFGEEDQLRIMCMGKGFVLNEVFDRLNTALQLVESIEGIEFATSSKYGYVTSCPTNLGTGMRASVHLKIPNLTADGTDAKAVAAAKPLGLSVRGTGGEHTPIGADGTVDISPSNRLFITEAEIVTKLYSGVKLLLEEETKAAPAGSGGCGADAAAVAAPATRKRGTSMGLLFRGESMEEATKQLPVVKEAAEAKAKKEAADAEATVSAAAAAAAATATTAPAAGAAGEGGGKKEQGEEEEEDNDEELDAMYEDLLKQAAKNTKGGRARGLTLDVVGEWDQVKEILASGTVDETTLGKIFDESFRDAAVGEHAFAALPPDAMQALTKLGNTMVPRREDSSDDSESDDGFDDDDFDAKPKPKPKKASTAAAATNRVSTVAEEADEFDYERPSVATSNGVRVITKEAFSKVNNNNK